MAQYPLAKTDLILNSDGSIYHLNLKPDHIHDHIITVGDPNRVHRISQHFDDVDFEMNKREFITHCGTYKGKKITVISTGMGTDNVEVLLSELDILVNIDLKKRQPKPKKRALNIVRIGTSGSIQQDIPIGSHVISEYAVGLDPMIVFYQMEMGALEQAISEKLQQEIGLPYLPYCTRGSDVLLERHKKDMIVGNTVTCHGFYAPQGREIRVPIRFPDLIQKLEYFHLEGLWLTNLEMETAGYYALAKLMGHEMVSVNAILANRITGEFAQNPNEVVDSLILKVLERI